MSKIHKLSQSELEIFILEHLKEELSVFAKKGSSLEGLGPETQFMGPNGLFDSIRLTHFIITLELKLSKKLGRNVSLTSGVSILSKKNPFRNVRSLVQYLLDTECIY